MKLNDEEEAGLVIMKVMSFREFNNLIKQNVLDNNLDNVSLFLNFGNNIVKASILELQPENTVNENDLERQIRSVQNDIVKILFDNNTDEDYASISDYLDNFNSTSDSPNIEQQPAADEIPEGQFAMFITLLIKQLDKKLSFWKGIMWPIYFENKLNPTHQKIPPAQVFIWKTQGALFSPQEEHHSFLSAPGHKNHSNS